MSEDAAISEDAGFLRALFRNRSQALVVPPECRASHVAAHIATFWHEDCEYVEDPAWPGSSAFHGRAALVERFCEYLEEIGNWSFEVHEVRSVSGRIVVLYTQAGTVGAQAVPFRQPSAWVVEMRDGLIRRAEVFLDQERALRGG